MPTRDVVNGEYTELHKEELSDLYFWPNILQVIKLRRIRYTGHEACMEEGVVHKVFVLKGDRKKGQ